MNAKFAYAAGMLDADGTVTLSRRNKLSRFRHPSVSVSNTDYNIIIWLKDNFGGKICSAKPRKSNHSIAYRWTLVYDEALNFLKCIRPYMVHTKKCYRTDILLNEYKQLTPRNGKYTDSLALEKLDMEERFFRKNLDFLS
jgi:hypothetical protein